MGGRDGEARSGEERVCEKKRSETDAEEEETGLKKRRSKTRLVEGLAELFHAFARSCMGHVGVTRS